MCIRDRYISVASKTLYLSFILGKQNKVSPCLKEAIEIRESTYPTKENTFSISFLFVSNCFKTQNKSNGSNKNTDFTSSSIPQKTISASLSSFASSLKNDMRFLTLSIIFIDSGKSGLIWVRNLYLKSSFAIIFSFSNWGIDPKYSYRLRSV